MNVTEDDLLTYIDLFHKTLERTSNDYLSAEVRETLLHISLTPALIVGYVSTQFGVAIEYQPASTTRIEIRRGSARVEDLFFQPPSAIRRAQPLITVGGASNHFSGSFSGRFPFRLTREEASLSIRDGVFEAGTWFRFVHYAEIYGNRLHEFWLPEKAVSRAKDEVLVALVEIQRARKREVSIAEYIRTFKTKTVLVLGDYDTSGMARMDEITHVLTRLGYEPILLKDIPDHLHQDLRQKVVAVGAVARFVVVDDSSKSGHLLEVQLCDQNKWVTVLLRAGGQGGSWMTAGMSYTSNVILEQPYDPTSPEASMTEAILWAEQKLQDLGIKFDGTYPWRHQIS